MEEKMKYVYTMVERAGKEKSRWVKIGVGFINKDNSLNIYFDALPLNGKVNVRDPQKEFDDN